MKFADDSFLFRPPPHLFSENGSETICSGFFRKLVVTAIRFRRIKTLLILFTRSWSPKTNELCSPYTTTRVFARVPLNTTRFIAVYLRVMFFDKDNRIRRVLKTLFCRVYENSRTGKKEHYKST